MTEHTLSVTEYNAPNNSEKYKICPFIQNYQEGFAQDEVYIIIYSSFSRIFYQHNHIIHIY